MYNPDSLGGVCSMHTDTNVDNNCGNEEEKHTWYDLRYFDANNEIGHGSLNTFGSGDKTKAECEQECARFESCGGITYTEGAAAECVLLREVTAEKVLCHQTDTGSMTLAKSAAASFEALESTFEAPECATIQEKEFGSVKCATEGHVIESIDFFYGKPNDNEDCTSGFKNNTACPSPNGLAEWALDCCKDEESCGFSCTSNECQCTSSSTLGPKILPILVLGLSSEYLCR